MATLRPSTNRLTTSLLRTPRLSPCTPIPIRLSLSSPSRSPSHQHHPNYSTSPSPSPSPSAPPPPLLQKLKSDLKTAMRAKDAPRLAVLRSILSAALNASKTAAPVVTDAQVVGLLRRARRAADEAAAEARGAARPDLVAREEAQARVLDEYVAGSGVEELGPEALRAAVEAVVKELGAGAGAEGAKVRVGDVMKALLAPGGPLDGKDVEKGELAKVVKEVVG
ncbi:GatB/YqeY domain-containing protein [Biscogniauxia sp. FL1348]|nr:GatB/YqeY domain-containing protein [Biscogniauxia sp. FL1348]